MVPQVPATVVTDYRQVAQTSGDCHEPCLAATSLVWLPRALFGCHGPCLAATGLLATGTGQVCIVACSEKNFPTTVCTRTELVCSDTTPTAVGTSVIWSRPAPGNRFPSPFWRKPASRLLLQTLWPPPTAVWKTKNSSVSAKHGP